MSLRNRLIFNVKWHRRFGLVCAFFVLLLSVTGLLLNHTGTLKLDRIKLHSPLLSALYNLPSANPVSFPVVDQWVSHDGLDSLFLGQTEIAQCVAPLKGAVTSGGLLQVLCEGELLLFTVKGEFLERITPLLGLPEGSQALALIDRQLLIKTDSRIVHADLDSLAFQPADIQPQAWVSAQAAPAKLSAFLASRGPSMDLEQVILDLHSGRLFGSLGVLVMDLVAVMLILLSITGFIAWQTSRKMRKR